MIKSINAKALLNNETFMQTIDELKTYNTNKFINSKFDDKIDRESAYVTIKALESIVSHLQSRANDEKFIK